MEEEKREDIKKIEMPVPEPVIIISKDEPEGIVVGLPDGRTIKPKTTVKK